MATLAISALGIAGLLTIVIGAISVAVRGEGRHRHREDRHRRSSAIVTAVCREIGELGVRSARPRPVVPTRLVTPEGCIRTQDGTLIRRAA